MQGKGFFTFLAVITTIVFGIILYSRVNEVESSIVRCKVDGCNWPSCTNPRAKGSLYCSIHREKYEKNDSSSDYKSSSSQKSYSNYNTTYKDSSKKSSSSSRSNTQTKTYGSSKYSKSKNVDTYGVNDYSDADSFADDYYEEFYDYEDDYEDEDEAYDAAVDYWEDNYDGDDE